MVYRGTSPMRNRLLVGPYSRPMPRVLWRSWGGGRFHSSAPTERGKACLSIRKYDHFSPTREIRRHVGALARNHHDGWKLQGHV
jgi:hypothetical protein